MSKSKRFSFILYVLILCLVQQQTVFAMHIMEGFLPPAWCIVWAVLCLPSLAIGIKKIGNILADNQQLIILLAMAGAFTFVLSALKLPSVNGSSSHMTGLGFAAILFGPSISSILAVIVLLFQALLLAHGGLTTLGANTFSMGVAGPIVAYLIYSVFKSIKCPKKVCIFLAAALGDLSTYIVTSIQLSLAYPSEVGGFLTSFIKFASIFALTQIPLAIIEGILTVVLINVISQYGKDLFVSLGRDVLASE